MPQPTRAPCSTPFDAGNVFSSIDALGGPVALSFTASSAGGSVAMGEDCRDERSDDASRSRAMHRKERRVSLLRDGSAGDDRSGSAPGACRDRGRRLSSRDSVAGRPGRAAVPWVVSNPIYVLSRGTTGGDGRADRGAEARRHALQQWPATGWHLENSAAIARRARRRARRRRHAVAASIRARRNRRRRSIRRRSSCR